MVGAFVSLISHCAAQGHRGDVKVVFRYDERHAWDDIEVDGDLKKIIVVDLTKSHFTLVVFELSNMTVIRYNGYNTGNAPHVSSVSGDGKRVIESLLAY